jgi:AraC-like DNA-binding protein
MSDVHNPATEERLARVMDELARYLSTRCSTEQKDVIVRKQTLQLRNDLCRAVAHSRRRILDIAQSARANAGNTASPDHSGPAMPGAHGLPAARLRRVMRHIDGALAEPLTVPALACVAGMSPSHFTALFKCSTGLSPHEAVLRRRIAKAKELLCQDTRTVAAIGCQLGFSSQAHFTTVFRRRVGVTPSAFRRGTGAPDTAKAGARVAKISANPAIQPAESESLRPLDAH